MLRILHGTSYDFIKWWKAMVFLTVAFIVIGAGMLTQRLVGGGVAVNYSIEFTGGTLLQLKFAQPPQEDDLRTTISQAGYAHAEIQRYGTPLDYTVRARLEGEQSATASADSTRLQIERALKAKLGTFLVARKDVGAAAR